MPMTSYDWSFLSGKTMRVMEDDLKRDTKTVYTMEKKLQEPDIGWNFDPGARQTR
jgi:hypothetical protein